MASKKLFHVFEWVCISTIDETYLIQCKYCKLSSLSINIKRLQKERCKERERIDRELELLSRGY